MKLFNNLILQFILILELIIIRNIKSTTSCLTANNCNDYPIYARIGFASKVIDFLDADVSNNIPEGYPDRNLLGSQQLLAFKLAINYCNHLSISDPTYDLNNDGILGDFYLHPVVYKGEQLFSFLYYMRKNNPYFDGAYGSYSLDLYREPVATVIAAQDDTDIVESMTSTFNGWDVPVYITKSQSTSFSHAYKFPNKKRIVPADNFQALILHNVLESYNWKRVGIFYADNTDGIDCYTNFRRSAPDYNVEILHTGHLDPNSDDYTILINNAIESGVTIFLLFMNNQLQSRLLKEGYTQGLLKDNTVFIGSTFSYDTNDIMSYLSNDKNKKDILRGYFSISWADRAYFNVPSGKKFIQMFKTGVLDGINLMSYPNGFKDTDPNTNSANFANDGTNPNGLQWFSKCKQWEYSASSQIYGPNIKDFSVANSNNNFCSSGSCGDNGIPAPANGLCAVATDCPTYIPPNSCELKYLKLCENFDADFNPLWVTSCDANSPLCGDGVATPKYPAENLVDGNGANLYGAPTDPPLAAGMCLGLERFELDSIPDDGSSIIDSSTLYIFDAVVNSYFLTAELIKSDIVAVYGGLPTGAIDPNTGLTEQEAVNAYINKAYGQFVGQMLSQPSDSTKLQSDPLPSMFTGPSINHFGFKEEDNFMYGDRVSGFVYRMNNYDEDTNILKVTGYYDPILKTYINCTSSGSVKVLGTAFPCFEATYRSSNVPIDMQPSETLSMSSPMKTSLYFFGIVCLLLTIFWSVLIALNWNHKALKLRQKYVLLFVIFSIYLGSFKTIITAAWDLTESYCAANYWLGHLSFRIMTLSLSFKLWRVDKLFNNTTLKRVKITETDVIKRIIAFTAILFAALIVHTGLSGPKIMTRTFVSNNVLYITPFCGLGHNFAAQVVDTIILVIQIISLALANYYFYRTLNVPPMINEASIIGPSVVMTTICSVIACVMLAVYNVDPTIQSFVIDMLFSLGGIVGSLLYFTAVFYQIYFKEKKNNKKGETIKPSSDIDSSNNNNNSSSNTNVKSMIVPIDENLDNLSYSVSQALLKRAKGYENKAMVCQNQIQFWRGQMVKIADADEYSTKSSSSSSVYADEDITSDSITSTSINDDDNKNP